MYSSDPMVRLLSGLALATFAYNNISEQKEIADQGGVRFNCFVPFLQSNDEMYSCLAAFQVYVLCVIIYESNLLFVIFINFMVYSVPEFQTKAICIFLL